MTSRITPSKKLALITPISLTALLRQEIRFPNARNRIRVDIPQLSSDERAAWQIRLDRLYNECGCAEGAAAFVASAACSFAFLFLQPGGIVATRWHHLGIAVVAVIAATVAGKGLGLWRARRRLRRALSELKNLIELNEVSC